MADRLLSLQFEEQQAFDRSRRFLRQLEISFGDNPSHYQKIIKALQTGPDLSPVSIQEVGLPDLKMSLMARLKVTVGLFWFPAQISDGHFAKRPYPSTSRILGIF